MRVRIIGLLPALFISACATQSTKQEQGPNNSSVVVKYEFRTCWDGTVLGPEVVCTPEPVPNAPAVSETKFCWDGSRARLGFVCPPPPTIAAPPKPFDPKTRPGPDNPDKIGFVWCMDGTGLTYNAYMAGSRCQPSGVY